jgi:hypothetical protein
VSVILLAFLLGLAQLATLQQSGRWSLGGNGGGGGEDSLEERLERLEETQSRLERTILNVFPALNDKFSLQNERIARILKGEPEPSPFLNNYDRPITNSTAFSSSLPSFLFSFSFSSSSTTTPPTPPTAPATHPPLLFLPLLLLLFLNLLPPSLVLISSLFYLELQKRNNSWSGWRDMQKNTKQYLKERDKK